MLFLGCCWFRRKEM
ncbi:MULTISPECIES: hypothetical protein [Acinetobacter]